jgi:hypothetical protein
VKREAPSQPGFHLDQTFFGYKPEDRVALHENIFNMIWWGEGRWDWDTIYNMPIPIRKLWTKKVNDIIEARNPKNTGTNNTGPKRAAPRKTQ